jgi:DNA-binding LacI/PurR family transcriptional regulator
MDPEPHRPRVSLRDIAKLMGVSHVTVSLALRDSRQISAKMKGEVRRIAEELGYRPDPMLSALASYRQSKADATYQATVGWINAWRDPKQLRSYEEFDGYWKGARLAAGKLGYTLEEFTLGGDISPGRLDKILTARGIRGILLPPHSDPPDWGDFPWEKYFIVKFGRSLNEPRSHLVAADQVLNTVLAYDEIRKLGYRRIGFVTAEPYMKAHGHLFEAGFLIAQQDVPKAQRLPVLRLAGMQSSEAAAALAEWLKKGRPDVIYTDVRGICPLLEKAGLRVPDDIAVAATTLRDTGVDSGIDQHPEEIGRVGMLLLHSIINDGAIGIPSIFRQSMVQGSWINGSTLPSRQSVLRNLTADQTTVA